MNCSVIVLSVPLFLTSGNEERIVIRFYICNKCVTPYCLHSLWTLHLTVLFDCFECCMNCSVIVLSVPLFLTSVC